MLSRFWQLTFDKRFMTRVLFLVSALVVAALAQWTLVPNTTNAVSSLYYPVDEGKQKTKKF